MKKIHIFYNDKLIESIGVAERLYRKISHDLENEGKKLNFINEKVANFEDGTSVTKTPFRNISLGIRATHVYIDSSIMSFENGNDLVQEVIKPCLITNSSLEFKTDENSVNKKIFFFNGHGVIDE